MRAVTPRRALGAGHAQERLVDEIGRLQRDAGALVPALRRHDAQFGVDPAYRRSVAAASPAATSEACA